MANALYVWGVARARAAEVLLRIEDHDRQRCRPEYEPALLDDLDWLGLRPDLGSTASYRAGASSYRQSDNGPVYAEAVDRLRAAGYRIYACDCSRKTDGVTTADGAEQGARPYTGRCRQRGLEPGPGRGLRVELPSREIRFDDLRLGAQRQEPAGQCGDLLLRDRVGNWTYQFSVAVDDLRQGVTLVVRGEDLLQSTGRQLQVAGMLGRTTATLFYHHPLILKPGGEKLSKSAGDTGVRELRAAGASAEAVIGRAAVAVGLTTAADPLALEAALDLVASGLR